MTFKLKAIKKYKEHLSWITTMKFENEEKGNYMISQFENIIACLSIESKCEVELFIEKSITIDKVRNENTLEIFPELKELFKK